MNAPGDHNAAGPPPNTVRYNDWRQVPVPDAAAFEPSEGVTVVVAYHEAPGELALALAALERQRYPRELLEVVGGGRRVAGAAPDACAPGARGARGAAAPPRIRPSPAPATSARARRATRSWCSSTAT